MNRIFYDVKPKGIMSAFLMESVPFDKGKKILEKRDLEIISLEDYARLVLQGEEFDGYIHGYYDYDDNYHGNRRCGNRSHSVVSDGQIYIQSKGAYLTKNSPIMKDSRRFMKALKKDGVAYLSDKEVEEALVNSVPVSSRKIPFNRFGEDEAMVFAFGMFAKDYGLLLNERMSSFLEGMDVEVDEVVKERHFAHQLHFNAEYPNIHPSNLLLGSYMRGVSKNIEGLYSADQIREVFNEDFLRNLNKAFFEVE